MAPAVPAIPKINTKLQAEVKPKVLVQPSPENDPRDNEAPINPITEVKPPVPPDFSDQSDLAAIGQQSQTVPLRNAMSPTISEVPPPIPSVINAKTKHYEFTDNDRSKAVATKAANKYDWENEPIDDALAYLAEIRAENERGAIILQKRISELKVERVKCFGCDNIINISEGRWAGMRTRNNFETGLPESAYACSAACMLKLNRDFTHPVRVPMARES